MQSNGNLQLAASAQLPPRLDSSCAHEIRCSHLPAGSTRCSHLPAGSTRSTADPVPAADACPWRRERDAPPAEQISKVSRVSRPQHRLKALPCKQGFESRFPFGRRAFNHVVAAARPAPTRLIPPSASALRHHAPPTGCGAAQPAHCCSLPPHRLHAAASPTRRPLTQQT